MGIQSYFILFYLNLIFIFNSVLVVAQLVGYFNTTTLCKDNFIKQIFLQNKDLTGIFRFDCLGHVLPELKAGQQRLSFTH